MSKSDALKRINRIRVLNDFFRSTFIGAPLQFLGVAHVAHGGVARQCTTAGAPCYTVSFALNNLPLFVFPGLG
jgi:hypothetical protein